MRLIDADKLLFHLSDYQLQESPGWGANGCGNADAYEAITNCIKAIEEAPVVVEDFDKEGMYILDFEQTAEKLGRSMFSNNSIHDLEELAEQVGAATIEEVRNEAKKDDPYKHDTDLISRRAAIKTVNKMRDACDTESLDDYRDLLVECFEVMPPAQPEQLTDKEQRIFLAAMEREEKVCEEVDRNYVREPYEDSLMSVCREIKRKVKGALWTR